GGHANADDRSRLGPRSRGCGRPPAYGDGHFDDTPLVWHDHAAFIFQLAIQAHDQHRIVDARNLADVAPGDPQLRAGLAIDHEDLTPVGLAIQPLVVLD